MESRADGTPPPTDSYEPPAVIELGTLEELTLGAGGGADGVTVGSL